MITFPSAPVVEMLGCLGFDWVLLDNEHGSITVDNSEDWCGLPSFPASRPSSAP